MRDEDIRHEVVERSSTTYDYDPRPFDRIAFAMRTLDRLAPCGMTVVVYEAVETLSVQQGTDSRGRWAIVGVPTHASREYIAYELARLMGVEFLPYAVQMLLDEGHTSPYR